MYIMFGVPLHSSTLGTYSCSVSMKMFCRPRMRWRTWMPKHLLWWGGVFLSLGGVMFCMGTTARLAGQFNSVHYTGVQSVSTKEAR